VRRAENSQGDAAIDETLGTEVVENADRRQRTDRQHGEQQEESRTQRTQDAGSHGRAGGAEVGAGGRTARPKIGVVLRNS